jgi:DNA-binding transcriptional LysR family regulator
MSLWSLDLKLLELLVRIHETGSVSLAGEQLGLSQPAASNALRRLREALGDPLFIRGREGMVATAYTERVVPAVRAHLAGLAAALATSSEFRPETARRNFRLSLSGLGEQSFLPPLARRIFAEAPHVRIENVALPMEALAGALARGEADAAIGILEAREPGLRRLHLFDEVFRVVGSPRLSAEEAARVRLEESRLILVAPSATYAEDVESSLARRGLAGNVAIRLRHFGALPELLASVDAFAVVPGQFAARLEAAGQARMLPVELPLRQSGVGLIWHRRTDHDPACIWLRARITELFEGSPHPLPESEAGQ